MNYSKLAEGLFQALAEEEDDTTAEGEISADADESKERPSVKESLLGTNLQKMLGAVSAGGIVVGLLGTGYNFFKGSGDHVNMVRTFLGIGGASLLIMVGLAVPNYRAESQVKQAEALVKATERYIRRQAEVQRQAEQEAKAAEEAQKRTKQAQVFLTDSKSGMGLSVDFSNPFNLIGATGNLGDFNASSGRNSGVVLAPNHSAQPFKWL